MNARSSLDDINLSVCDLWARKRIWMLWKTNCKREEEMFIKRTLQFINAHSNEKFPLFLNKNAVILFSFCLFFYREMKIKVNFTNLFNVFFTRFSTIFLSTFTWDIRANMRFGSKSFSLHKESLFTDQFKPYVSTNRRRSSFAAQHFCLYCKF